MGIVCLFYANFQSTNAQQSLFISEYCGGNPNYAWLEFYNPSNETLNLEGYKILTCPQWLTGFTNIPPEYTFHLTGTLAPGTVYVIANNTCPKEVLTIADTLLVWDEKTQPEPWQQIARFYNGDETIGLFFHDTLIDIIGNPDDSPRLAWDVAGIAAATNQYTLLRKPEVMHGNPDWDISRGTTSDNSEWIVAGQNLTGFIGFYPGKGEITSEIYSIVPYSEKLIYKYRIENIPSKSTVLQLYGGMSFSGLAHKVLNNAGIEKDNDSFIEEGDKLIVLTSKSTVYRSFNLIKNYFDIDSPDYQIFAGSDTGTIDGVSWNTGETDFLDRIEKCDYVNWQVLHLPDHPEGIITSGDLLKVYDPSDTFIYNIITLTEPLHLTGLTSTIYHISAGHDIDTVTGIMFRTDTAEFKSNVFPSEGAGSYITYGQGHPGINEIISGDTLCVVAGDKITTKRYLLNVNPDPDSTATLISDIYHINNSQDTIFDILIKTNVSTLLTGLSKAPSASWAVTDFYSLPVEPVAIVRTGFNLKVTAEDGTVRNYKLVVREREVQEIAQVRNFPPMSPRYSDVILRNINFRTGTYDSFKAIKDFHATRMEWVYVNFTEADKTKIEQVKNLGLLFGAASSGSTFHSPIPKQELWQEKIDGNPPIPNWMIEWPDPQIFCCMNKPGFIEGNLAYFEDLIDMGADVIQRDEPFSSGYLSCFCKYCMPAFTEYLKKNHTPSQLGIDSLENFNYKDYLLSKGINPDDVVATQKNTPLYLAYSNFQIKFSTDFHRHISSEIDKYAGRHITRSCNNAARWNEVHLPFEYGNTESWFRDFNPLTIYDWCNTARGLGKYLTITKPCQIPPEYTNDQIVSVIRRFGALLTAGGANFQIPFDVFDTYKDGSTAPRYFGLPSEYADMFGFIRGIPQYLEGYEDAAVLIKNYTDRRYDGDFPVSVPDPLRNIVAVVRSKPGDKQGAKVIHLIDWDSKGSFSFRIKGETFFPGYQLKVRLFTPKVYNAAEHTLAENDAIAMLPPDGRRGPGQAAAYTRLIDSLELSVTVKDQWSEVTIPALEPWGVLVIEKGEPLSALIPVSTPVFFLGESSTRSRAAGSVIYSATAANSTGIAYSMDPVSEAAGNRIIPQTGEVTYDAGWIGTAGITATADGFNGPVSAIHIAVTTPVTKLPEVTGPELIIFPNPFESYLEIEGAAPFTKVEVISICGKIIIEKQINNEASILLNTADVLPGIYFIKLFAEKVIEIKKLVKIR